MTKIVRRDSREPPKEPQNSSSALQRLRPYFVQFAVFNFHYALLCKHLNLLHLPTLKQNALFNLLLSQLKTSKVNLF